MTLRENVRALLRAAPTVGEEMAVDLIIAAVEADMIKRRADRATVHGRIGAEVRKQKALERKGATSTLEAPYKGATSTLNSSAHKSDPDQDLDPEKKEPEYCADVEPFPVVGGDVTEWRLTRGTVRELLGAFPGVDVVAECRKARVWLVTNAPKRKTPKGMERFLFNWITGSVERGKATPRGNGEPAKPTGPTFCNWHGDYRNNGKPSKFPKPECPECKHVAAKGRRADGAGEPASVGDLLGGAP